MSLDKSIEHGKEHRKKYRGAKAVDKTCRNHGGCAALFCISAVCTRFSVSPIQEAFMTEEEKQDKEAVQDLMAFKERYKEE